MSHDNHSLEIDRRRNVFQVSAFIEHFEYVFILFSIEEVILLIYFLGNLFLLKTLEFCKMLHHLRIR